MKKTVITDYAISGLGTPALNISMAGSRYFINRACAQMLSSEEYRLDEVEIAAGEANLVFAPTGRVSEDIRKACGRCLITICPNPAFFLTVRQIDSYWNKNVTKYVLLSCREDKHGKPYFHFDELRRESEGLDGIVDLKDATVDELLARGYKLQCSGDDAEEELYSTIYGRKIAS